MAAYPLWKWSWTNPPQSSQAWDEVRYPVWALSLSWVVCSKKTARFLCSKPPFNINWVIYCLQKLTLALTRSQNWWAVPVISKTKRDSFVSFRSAPVLVWKRRFVFFYLAYIVGTLRTATTTAVKTSLKKWICILSNLIASIWTSSICQMRATFPGVELLRILFKLKEELRKNSSSYVHVLHKKWNLEVSLRSRAVDVKEMY